ncbi:cytochrome bd-I oxidase subunit CydX [Breoghania sp. JC706]
MWYFAWVLGVTAALCISVINVMWFEFQDDFERKNGNGNGSDQGA